MQTSKIFNLDGGSDELPNNQIEYENQIEEDVKRLTHNSINELVQIIDSNPKTESIASNQVNGTPLTSKSNEETN